MDNLENTFTNKVDGVEKLKRISVRDIEQQTHIDVDTIESILSFDFKNLRKVKTKAMIKILEREYNVDLSEWVKKFDEYCNASPVEEQKHMKVMPTLKKYDQDAIGGGGIKWSFLIIFIVVLIVAGLLVKFPSIFGDFLNYESTKNATSLENTLVNIEGNVSQETKELKTENTVKISNAEEAINLSNNDTQDKENIVQNELASKVDSYDLKEQNQSDVDVNAEKDKEEDSLKEVKKEEDLGYTYISTYATKEVKVMPIKVVWFSMYDMDTKKTKTFTSNKPFTISNKTLVLAGNSLFNLEAAGQKIDFEDRSIRRRFYFDGDNLNIVDEENYNKIKNFK